MLDDMKIFRDLTEEECQQLHDAIKWCHDNNSGCASPIVACVIFAVFMLFSCKSVEYVPYEVVKKEIVHKTDTVEKKVETNKETNTIIREGRPEDSVLLAKLGIKLSANERLLILQQQQISDLTNELKEIHNKDSVRDDSVQVPVPYERKLSRWEQTCLDYGRVMMGGTIVAIIVIILWIISWIKKRIRNRV